jgi:DNA topoisomerase-1
MLPWMMERLAAQVLARYKAKKQVVTEKGDKVTVYEYSDRQIANRNRHKAEQIAKLEKNIGNLRKRVQRDLKSDDPDTMLTALAVALMDHTYERVGNDGSAEEGHFGVTGWQRKHVSFGKGKATVRYVGKSGVKHEKVVSDRAIMKALRDAYEASEGDDACLFCHDSGKVDAKKVNGMLKEFGVTAKDVRGFHANREMRERLSAVRSKGKALPEDKKARDKQLKAEFLKALGETAEAVGHEAATLRSQYLTPELESRYMHDGTVEPISKSSSSLATRIVARYTGDPAT